MQIWGTCAGLVLLSDKIQNQAMGEEHHIGGLDIEVSRNFFGSQVKRYIWNWNAGFCQLFDHSYLRFIAVKEKSIWIYLRFRRLILKFRKCCVMFHHSMQPSLEHLLLLRYYANLILLALDYRSFFCLYFFNKCQKSGPAATIIATVLVDDLEIGVAAIQDNILATAFHPELTNDFTWHRYVILMI